MNCFVIMPLSPEFDDVYLAIKTSVTRATSPNDCRCFRIDEQRPAGRITDRLLNELRAASLCIADLTGNRPNVMWEVGFAMALACPTIIVTQALADLPFDIKDMQSVQYDRNSLSRTLSQPLRQMVVDTLSVPNRRRGTSPGNADLVGELLAQIADLKNLVAQVVRSWGRPLDTSADGANAVERELFALEGAWINEEDGSHVYARVIKGDLLAPYCYKGNKMLNGAYFHWRRAGPYWFARYAWLNGDFAGFTFLNQESVDVLRGAWWAVDAWSDDQPGMGHPLTPPTTAGIPSTWRRVSNTRFPKWAVEFLKRGESEGIPSQLLRR